MTKRDALSNVQNVQSIAPANQTADVNGTAVAVHDAEEVEVMFVVGLYQAGDFTLGLEESDDGSTGWTDVAAADLSGSFPTLSGSNDNDTHSVGYLGKKKYIRPTIGEPTSPNPAGCVIGCVVAKRGVHLAPTS